MKQILPLLATLSLLACAPAPTSGPPPQNAKQYAIKPLAIGTTLIYRKITNDGDTATTSTVEEITSFNGRPAYRVAGANGNNFYDVETNNWMGSTDSVGKATVTAAPHWGQYQWPLWVGKTYRVSIDYTDHRQGRTWYDMTPAWTVEAAETVSVPAGTFETLRMRQKDNGRHVAFASTRWYSPELGVDVKVINTRTGRSYLGKGRTERVLVSFEAPSQVE